MKRIYLLLAAMLIASTFAALSVGEAGAAYSPSKRYAAIAVSPSTVSQWFGYGSTKYKAENNAYLNCQKSAQQFKGYTGDCQGAVWVKNAWVAAAYEGTQEQPYKNLAWGSGWGPTEGDAEDHARHTCRKYAHEYCTVQDVQSSSLSKHISTTGGSW